MPASAPKLGLPAALSIALVLSVMAPTLRAASNEKEVRIRLALSDTLFLNINENDARAAVRAWTESVAGPSHMKVDSDSLLLSPDEIVRSISNHLVDAFTITLPEYARVAAFVDPVIFVDEGSANEGAEYLLLVRQDSGIRDLPSLRGHSLLMYEHTSTCVAPAWLETLLASSNLGPSDRFFAAITKSMKPSQTVLPVFFGRADACLVTRRAFDVMSELNPQLRQKLKVIATSPKVLIAFVGVQKDSSDEIKTRMREAVLGLDSTPSGHQVLTLFESRRMIAMNTSSLRASVEIIEAYNRLKTKRSGGSK